MSCVGEGHRSEINYRRRGWWGPAFIGWRDFKVRRAHWSCNIGIRGDIEDERDLQLCESEFVALSMISGTPCACVT